MADLKEQSTDQLAPYANWKRWREQPESIEDHLPAGASGTWIAGAFRFLRNVSFRKDAETFRYPEHEETAQLLLRNETFRARLREELQSFRKSGVLMEKDVVNIVVGTLSKEDLAREFKIGADPVLFAAIAYEVIDLGIDEFCPSEVPNTR